MRENSRIIFADALHQAGEFQKAEKLFQEVETMRKERNASDLYHFVTGFMVYDFLLSQLEYPEVKKRTEKALKSDTEDNWLLNIPLAKLSLGRAHLLQTLEGKAYDFSKAKDYLEKAVEGLREAGVQEYLPRGLFARATIHRKMREFTRAWDDLEEAREFVERGEMRLHLADYHLEAARLHLAQDQQAEARESLEIAERMVEEMGYHRRDKEIYELTRMTRI